MTATPALIRAAQQLAAAGLDITIPRLRFVAVLPELVRGAYPIGKHTPNGMPLRALFVHPEVWPAFKAVASRIVITDLTRSAESSLARMQTAPGLAQPPGWSGHGVGGAFDLDIKASLERGNWSNRTQMDEELAYHGFPPFWWVPGANAPPPNKPGAEVYHHSYLPIGLRVPRGRSTAVVADGLMLEWYPWLDLSTWRNPLLTAQYLLKRLGHYSGALDAGEGDERNFGPLSKTALAMFQRALMVRSWCRKKGVTDFAEGKLDKATARVLAFCAAERDVVAP